jgi:TonB family protein
VHVVPLVLLFALAAPEQPQNAPAASQTPHITQATSTAPSPSTASQSSSQKSSHGSRCALIEAVLDESGHIKEAHIVKTSRDAAFDQLALKQVKQWKYEPAKYQGKPVPVLLSTSVCPHLAY